jgi:hypothetical protein
MNRAVHGNLPVTDYLALGGHHNKDFPMWRRIGVVSSIREPRPRGKRAKGFASHSCVGFGAWSVV